MADKKMIIKKSESSLFGIIISLLLVIGVFIGLFMYLNFNMQQSGKTLDGQYNLTYQRLNNVTTDIDNNINDISTSAKGLTEADPSWQVAWNGIRGLGSLLKLPLNFIDAGQETFESFTIGSLVIPSWAWTLIRIGIIAFIVIVVISILKGDSNMIK